MSIILKYSLDFFKNNIKIKVPIIKGLDINIKPKFNQINGEFMGINETTVNFH